MLSALCCLGGCYSDGDDSANRQQRTSVDIQALQTRQFECSYKVAFAAVVDVFQDLGFVIQSSDFTTGLVIAKSNVQSRESLGFSTFKPETKATWDVGTAHVEEVGHNIVSVRVSFVRHKKASYEYGSSSESSFAITDGRFYTNFFEKVDKSIFIRHNLKATANDPF
ncbi:MAG: hypothetical protein LBI61_03785 [Puniceicoccales bacterium]|nr:hypothetical protein [Puniceicoccales bacterium]